MYNAGLGIEWTGSGNADHPRMTQTGGIRDRLDKARHSRENLIWSFFRVCWNTLPMLDGARRSDDCRTEIRSAEVDADHLPLAGHAFVSF
jgi:hypothetical protein